MGICNSNTAQHQKHHESRLSVAEKSNIHETAPINSKPLQTVSLNTKTLQSFPIIDKISVYTKYDDINKFYTLGAHRGSGSFGIVREAEEKLSSKKFAVKTVWKGQFVDKKKFILQEIEILLQIEHPNIIKCYEVYEDHNCIHFVCDLIDGGDLFDYLISSPNHMIPDTRAVDFFNQILDALQYLHEKNIVHRDIKPENFLVYHSGNSIKLKLIDFGFAAMIKNGEKLSDKLGSLQYIAPEMLKDDEYDSKVDIWAAGVVLFNMITGKQPFCGKSDNELINNIINSEVLYNENYFKNVHAKILCANLLNRNPLDRFNANDAKCSMWIQNFININVLPTYTDVKFQPKEENIKNILAILNQQSTVKTDVWDLLLTYLSVETLNNLTKKLKELQNQTLSMEINFTEGTIGGTDSVSYEFLLTTLIENFNIDIELYNKINELLSSKKEICEKKVVKYKEFLEKLTKCKMILIKERVWNIFKNLDKKGTGYLTYDQMNQAFKEYFPKYDADKMKELIKMSTVDNKNSFKYEEFYNLWEKVSNLN